MRQILEAYRAWRRRRAARIKAAAERDPITQWLRDLPPASRKAVPARRRRKTA